MLYWISNLPFARDMLLVLSIGCSHSFHLLRPYSTLPPNIPRHTSSPKTLALTVIALFSKEIAIQFQTLCAAFMAVTVHPNDYGLRRKSLTRCSGDGACGIGYNKRIAARDETTYAVVVGHLMTV